MVGYQEKSSDPRGSTTVSSLNLTSTWRGLVWFGLLWFGLVWFGRGEGSISSKYGQNMESKNFVSTWVMIWVNTGKIWIDKDLSVSVATEFMRFCILRKQLCIPVWFLSMEEKRTWVLAEDDDMILRENVHLGKPSFVKSNILCEINS